MSIYRIENIHEFDEALEKADFRGMRSDHCAGILYGVIVRLKAAGYRPRAIKHILMNRGVLTSNNMPRFVRTGAGRGADPYALELLLGMEPYAPEAGLPVKLPSPVRTPKPAKAEPAKAEPAKAEPAKEPAQMKPEPPATKTELMEMKRKQARAAVEDRYDAGDTDQADSGETEAGGNAAGVEHGAGGAGSGIGTDAGTGSLESGNPGDDGDDESARRRRIAEQRLADLRKRSEGTGRRA